MGDFARLLDNGSDAGDAADDTGTPPPGEIVKAGQSLRSRGLRRFTIFYAVFNAALRARDVQAQVGMHPSSCTCIRHNSDRIGSFRERKCDQCSTGEIVEGFHHRPYGGCRKLSPMTVTVPMMSFSYV